MPEEIDEPIGGLPGLPNLAKERLVGRRRGVWVHYIVIGGRGARGAALIGGNDTRDVVIVGRGRNGNISHCPAQGGLGEPLAGMVVVKLVVVATQPYASGGRLMAAVIE